VDAVAVHTPVAICKLPQQQLEPLLELGVQRDGQHVREPARAARPRAAIMIPNAAAATEARIAAAR
jgi:hypothetical protein